MALAISMREGHDFYVGESHFQVYKITSAREFSLTEIDGPLHIVTDTDWTTVGKGMRIQAGIPRNPDNPKLVRVVIDAPGISVIRGDLSRRTQKCPSCSGRGTLTQHITHKHCGGHGCLTCKSGVVEETFKCPDCS